MTQNENIHPLRRWRLDRNLALERAAKKVGTTRQLWFGWENGVVPSRKYMPRLLSLTGISADAFYGHSDDAAQAA